MARTTVETTFKPVAPLVDSKASRSGKKSEESYRETVEAIVVAFILALLVRGFEAEAFVIPTGSMAPTLMGRHKEITCPQCGYVYAVNASEEVEGVASDRSPRVATGICVNCRYPAQVAKEPSFKGDRILVMKFPYDLPFLPGSAEPKRWDVVVFRYPEEPEVSYIKRLVGLPGETLRIHQGDVFIKPPGAKDFHLEHRPLEHQRAMQMMVYDDTHRPRALKNRPEWRRWAATDEASWKENREIPGLYEAEPNATTWSELRYRHVVPEPAQWREVESEETLTRQPRPTLVTDFYSYNTNTDEAGRFGVSYGHEGSWMQPHWVGDLTVAAQIETETPKGSIRLDLIEGGVIHRCEVDIATGTARISRGGKEIGTYPTLLKGAGTHDVEFANVDNRLTLWVDGNPAFGDGLTYEDDPEKHPEPTVEDLSPVRIAVQGGRFLVSDLVLRRDIYYTLDPGAADYGRAWESPLPRTPSELFDLLADPARVAALGPLKSGDYPIAADRFLMLGDNSPRSKDSRGWGQCDRYVPPDTASGIPERGWEKADRQRWEVPRKLLTGKAFCIYWPHGKPFGPDIRLRPDFRVPFRPYFERMKWIH
jgi:signal peptidase I